MRKYNNKYTYILLLVLLFIILITCLLRGNSLPTEIVGVYINQDEQATGLERGLAVVVLKNPPSTEKGMVKFLKDNQERLTRLYNIPYFNEFTKTDKYNPYSVIFVKDDFENATDTFSLKYFMGDQEMCFYGLLNNQCISVENYLFRIYSSSGFTEQKEYVTKSGRTEVIKLGSGYADLDILQM